VIERKHGTVGRYTPGARVNHWLNAIILILLALSGMSLFHPALFFLSGLFGGGTWTRILHPWLGLALVVTFTGLFLRFWRSNLWAGEDSLWMRRIGDVVAKHDENIPEVGRYNAGQKIVFWGMTILILVLGTSGVVMWDARSAIFLVEETCRLSSMRRQQSSHDCGSSMFMPRFEGTVRAMTQGWPGGWAATTAMAAREVAKEPR
jgi:formate dehydrogenase subunit gamma